MIKKDREFLISRGNDKTLREWAEYFDNKYSKKTIHNILFQNGVKAKNNNFINKQLPQYNNINKNYFSSWSSNMAYVVGIWFAVGFIYENNYIFDITMRNKDKYIMRQIANQLGYQHDLADPVNKQISRINFSCAIIYQDIKAISIEDVPSDYLKDFIRGYFDGTGDLLSVSGCRKNVTLSFKDENFAKIFQQRLKEELGILGSYDKINKVLKYGTKESILFGDYIYKNSPELFLLRKKKKFL